MTIQELNKAIALCNPYTDKELRRYLIGQRRKLERVEQSIQDINTGNVPEMLKKQAGV